MKTLLLKREQILSFIILIFCASPLIKAQNNSNDIAASVQSFRLEFNSVDGPSVTRSLQLSFSDNTSDNFDEGYDTKNLLLMQDDLNLLQNGEYYISQAYSPITEDKIANLVFQASGNYNYTIELTTMENMDNQSIRLRDNYTGEIFNLKNSGTYQFSSQQGYFEDRFEVFFKSEETLSQTEFEIEGVDVRYLSASNTILVSNTNSSDVKDVEIYNISGQKVFSDNTVNDENLIKYELGKINSGIYIVKLVTEKNGLFTKKIIVN